MGTTTKTIDMSAEEFLKDKYGEFGLALDTTVTTKFEDMEAYAKQEIENGIERLINSLGDKVSSNSYTIDFETTLRSTVRGEFWITHKEVGSGEPLQQWLKSELLKQ